MTAWHKPYSAYLFDLDGTLVDTAPDINAALNYTLRTYGFDEVEEHLTRHWIGHGARVLIEQALKHRTGSISDTDSAAMLDVFLTHYRAHLADLSKPYPDVVTTLQALGQRGAKLAVVTNKIASLAEPLVQEIGLGAHFDLLVSGDTTPRPKPAPDPVLLALEQLAVAPEDALFVGDSAADIDAAQAAAVTVVCVRDGYNHGLDPATLGADGIIDSFRELL